MSKFEVGAGMAVSNMEEDLREHDDQQQQLLQQQQFQQQYQQDRGDLPNIKAPRPNNERLTTQNETTNIAADDDLIMQNFPQEEQEHAVEQELQTALITSDVEADEIDLSAVTGE